MKECKNCKHYGFGYGEADCLFCDPLFDDRYEEAEEEEDDDGQTRIDG